MRNRSVTWPVFYFYITVRFCIFIPMAIRKILDELNTNEVHPCFDDTVYYKMKIGGSFGMLCYDQSIHGTLICKYESDCGRLFELRLLGDYEVRNQANVKLDAISWYAEYIRRDWKHLLQYCQVPVLRLIEISQETKNPIETEFHGVYYRVSDAEHYLIAQFKKMIFCNIGSPSM